MIAPSLIICGLVEYTSHPTILQYRFQLIAIIKRIADSEVSAYNH